MPDTEVERICNIEDGLQRRVEKDMWELANQTPQLGLVVPNGILGQLPGAVLS